MSEPFNLDAVIAEREDTPFTFTFGGEDFELPASFPLDTVGLMEAGKMSESLEGLLGPEQWDRLESLDAVLDVFAFENLVEAYCGHLGIDLGKSPPSASSSNRTERRSKRTSSGSTPRR